MKIKIFNYFVYSYYGKFQKQKLWGSKSTQIENYIQSTPSLIFLNGQNFLRKNKKKRKIVPMKEKKNKKENE